MSDPGRLRARPQRPEPGAGAPVGRSALPHGAELYVPDAYDGLVVTLHGANAPSERGFDPLLQLADEAGLILLAPKSQRETWDVVYGRFGPDAAVIDELLADLFGRYAIDPRRVFVSGFSDGASCALSLGLTNGDLFAGIAAFSPGFAHTPSVAGKPRVFISHGTTDHVIPIDKTSGQIVGRLRREGYDVIYREFEGPHVVPPAVAREAVEWMEPPR
jgi:phospholipase/carboxylesterase